MPQPGWAADATLLYIVGAGPPDRDRRNKDQLHLSGITDIPLLLGKSEPYQMLFVPPDGFRPDRLPDLTRYRRLVNLVTEPEGNEQILTVLQDLLRDLPGTTLNRPEAVLRSTRDQVASRLAGIDNLVAPRAVRLEAGDRDNAVQAVERVGLTFPVILRRAGTHAGAIAGLFDDADRMKAALGESSDHIATEFTDFRSADGLYRKYRAFFFGSRILLRHMLVSDDWNVHMKDRKRFMAGRPDLIVEEKSLFDRPERAFPPAVVQALEEVRKRMSLDFFGMDFGIAADGRVVLFEANATMNFFPFLPDPKFTYTRRCLEPARSAYRELLGLESRPMPGEAGLRPLDRATS